MAGTLLESVDRLRAGGLCGVKETREALGIDRQLLTEDQAAPMASDLVVEFLQHQTPGVAQHVEGGNTFDTEALAYVSRHRPARDRFGRSNPKIVVWAALILPGRFAGTCLLYTSPSPRD